MTTEPPIGIIQTRLSCSSLLGKVLKPLAERPMIWHIMQHARAPQWADELVAANQPKR
jgi:spore coat polysaccharide biosynthesis protein SpsF (cytidylyltransferase family)